MDRMLYVSMSGAQQTMLAMRANTNNLANANTTGFRADITQFRSMPVFGEGYPSRVYAMTERPAVDYTIGMVRSTDRELDISIDGKGWIAVQAQDGAEAYTRAGNFSIESGGILTTGSGHPVLGNGGPIALPQAEKISIGSDGTISIQPIGQDATSLVVVDRIKLVNPNNTQLHKGEDGLFRLHSGQEADVDAGVKVIPGSLETGNVNIVDAMVNMIDLSRRYQAQVKLMKTAEEIGGATDSMLRLS